MIEIIPLRVEDLFSKEYISSLDIIKESDNNCFITSLQLISQLLTIDLPINNKRLSIINILSFLNYFDSISDEYNIATINSNILINYFTTKEYKKYLAILKDLNVISEIPYDDGKFYTPKIKSCDGIGKSKRYRTFTQFNESDLCLVIIDSNKPPRIEIEDNIVDNKFKNTICEMDFNYKNAICAEIDNYQNTGMKIDRLRKRISRLFSLKVKRYIKSGNKVDRVYHSLSNLSKISRKYSLVQFNNIDIVNCQPLLLCAYLIKNGYTIDEQYKNDCEKGKIYENFITDEMNRDDVKVELYKSIYFKFNKNNDINKGFKEIYPLTWLSLLEISKDDKSMASILQNFEASLFNKLIPNRSEYYYTLFDAVYFDNMIDSADLVKNINKFFNELNIKVTLSLNDIKISK